MLTVEFEYGIGDCVCVRDYPDISGRVVSMCVRTLGLIYSVVWWHEGRRLEEWLYGWELKPCHEKQLRNAGT